MNFIIHKFKIYIINLKILIIFSNYNIILSNIIINNFYKRLSFLGFIKNNLLIIIIKGCLEIFVILNILFIKNIFDLYILFGIILKNKTFHFELVSLNSNFFISKISYKFNIPVINSLIISNNKYYFINKLIKINNNNIKILIKFLNFLYFLK